MQISSPYQQKIWLKSYDKDVKPEIEIETVSLAQTFKDAVRDFPNKLCYDFRGVTQTYSEVEKNINGFANFLVQNGVKKGDRVAIHLPNTPQYLIALYGTFYAGCTQVGVNFLLKSIYLPL